MSGASDGNGSKVLRGSKDYWKSFGAYLGRPRGGSVQGRNLEGIFDSKNLGLWDLGMEKDRTMYAPVGLMDCGTMRV